MYGKEIGMLENNIGIDWNNHRC